MEENASSLTASQNGARQTRANAALHLPDHYYAAARLTGQGTFALHK
jgi:hypothetical protein